MMTTPNAKQYVFDGSTTQWIFLGKAARACSEVGLKEQMSREDDTTTVTLYDFREQEVVSKEFGSHDIEYAAQWLHKQARDFRSWK